MIIAITANSCIDYYKITTKINADGSVTRTIQVVCDDSTSVFDGNMKIPTDSSWDISQGMYYEVPGDTNSDKKWEYTATKTFRNVEELNSFLEVKSDTSTQIQIETRFEKKFRWFFTYLKYTETYLKSFPYDYYPPEDFLTESEMSYIMDDDYTYLPEYDSLVHIKNLDQIPELTHKDSVRMDDLEEDVLSRFSEFMGRNIYEELFSVVSDYYADIDTSVYHYLLDNKESLFQECNFDLIFGHWYDLYETEDPYEVFIKKLNINANADSALKTKVLKFDDRLELVAEFYMADEEIKNVVEMPGLLLNTNADSIKNAESYWNFSEHYFFINDYEMVSESRIVNRWAINITFVTALALLFILVITGTRRRRMLRKKV